MAPQAAPRPDRAVSHTPRRVRYPAPCPIPRAVSDTPRRVRYPGAVSATPGPCPLPRRPVRYPASCPIPRAASIPRGRVRYPAPRPYPGVLSATPRRVRYPASCPLPRSASVTEPRPLPRAAFATPASCPIPRAASDTPRRARYPAPCPITRSAFVTASCPLPRAVSDNPLCVRYRAATARKRSFPDISPRVPCRAPPHGCPHNRNFLESSTEWPLPSRTDVNPVALSHLNDQAGIASSPIFFHHGLAGFTASFTALMFFTPSPESQSSKA